MAILISFCYHQGCATLLSYVGCNEFKVRSKHVQQSNLPSVAQKTFPDKNAIGPQHNSKTHN